MKIKFNVYTDYKDWGDHWHRYYFLSFHMDYFKPDKWLSFDIVLLGLHLEINFMKGTKDETT